MSAEDLFIPDHNVIVLGTTQNTVIDPMREAFRSPETGEWAHVFAEAERLTEDGTEKAFLIPATRFLVKSALGILDQPEVEEQLPSEVEDKADLTFRLIDRIAETAVSRGDFKIGYQQAGIYSLGSNSDLKDLVHSPRTSKLAGAVFLDSGAVVGGALRKLREEHPEEENPAEVIKRSKGLLVMAKVVKDQLPQLYNGLGQPYVHSDKLEATDSPDGLRIGLSRETFSDVRTHFPSQSKKQDRGCPMAKVKSYEGGGSMLQQDYEEIVDYLAPEYASVEAYEEYSFEPAAI